MTSSAIDCDVISRTRTERMRHGDDMWRSSFLSAFMDSLCRIRKKMMFVLEWQTVFCAHERIILVFILRVAQKLGNIYQNNLPWAHKQFATRVYIFVSIYKEFRLFYFYKRCFEHIMYQVNIFDDKTESTIIQMYTFYISQMCDNSMLPCGFRLEICSA